jgi:hypothetical protein
VSIKANAVYGHLLTTIFMKKSSQKVVKLLLLQCTLLRVVRSEESIDLKYEYYAEADGRVKVEATYAKVGVDLTDEWALEVTGLVDTITGASPTGMPAEAPGEKLPVAELPGEDRISGVVDVTWQRGGSGLLMEVSYSDEPDYIARGWAIQATKDINNRLTTLRAGAAGLNDTVMSSPVGTDRSSIDYLVGLTQIIDANTTLTFNLGLGENKGYLGDPYKVVARTQVTTIPMPIGDPITVEQIVAYEENRPQRRHKFVAYLEGQRYFDRLNGSAEASIRYFKDNWSVDSLTMEVSWFQKLGKKWILQPLYRFYQQSAADFYMTTLDTIDYTPPALRPSGTGPYYSADYRLSKLEAHTVGFKLVWFAHERLTCDLAYERYTMRGQDGFTQKDAYPKADIITIGANYAF